jgi:diadenosine tetraphosphate (Ap4A) HIT family hydrolase
MRACPFCYPSVDEHLAAESELVKVIFSNPRLVKGHLLVIPKRHIERPWELTSQEQAEIGAMITTWQRQLLQAIGTGCDMRQNYRPFLVQGRLKVDHVHYDLLPRTFEDELYVKGQVHEKAIFADLTDQEVAEIKGLLKIAI